MKPCLRSDCGVPVADGSYCDADRPRRVGRARRRDLDTAERRKLRRRDLRPGVRCFDRGAAATELDHVYPVSKFGPNTAVVPSCKPCNSAKGDKVPTERQARLLGILQRRG